MPSTKRGNFDVYLTQLLQLFHMSLIYWRLHFRSLSKSPTHLWTRSHPEMVGDMSHV